MRISVAVQHHPARAGLLPGLLERLGDAEIVTDPDPDHEIRSPMRTYMEALRRTPSWATHRLVVQDDTLPCLDFTAKLHARVAERPDDMIALFVPGCAPHRSRILDAVVKRERWAVLFGLWLPTVAMVWPVRRIPEFFAYCDRKGWDPLVQKGDDGPVGSFCQTRRIPAWATVPSLVEHPDAEASLIGRKARAGENIARVAVYFDADDGPHVRVGKRQRVPGNATA